MISFFNLLISSSLKLYHIDFKLQASSIRSIALSGKYLSVIYLIDKLTAEVIASSFMFKL
jgi:hypothetical protein